MRIRQIRESHNMTQKQVADHVGVSRSTLAMWECGLNYPRVEILIKLSQLFGCTIDELIFGGRKEEDG